MRRYQFALISLLFALSGATGLIYETLWVRVLSLGVGSTSASLSLVLSIYFFGLAAGSFLVSRFAEKIKRPLQFYAILEAAVGVYSFALIYILFNFQSVLGSLIAISSISFVSVFQFLIVALLLAPPTLAMGATLPVLVAALSKRDANQGSTISILYGVNTLGAVLGTFSTGFFLIPALGIVWSNHLAVAVNLAIAGVALLLQKQLATETSAIEEASEPATALTVEEKVLILSAGASGFVSIGAEVLWNKYIGIFFGTNIYGLSMVLAVFLAGIGIGSLIASRLLFQNNSIRTLIVGISLAFTVSLCTSSYALNLLPIWASSVNELTQGLVSPFFIRTMLTLLVLLIPTCLSGALLPLTISLLVSKSRNASQAVGTAYAANTVGAIIGSALVGLLLIPYLGSSKTLTLLLFISGALNVLLARILVPKSSLRNSYLGLSAAALVAIVFLPKLSFTNVLRAAYPGWELVEKTEQQEEYFFVVEGENGIISLSHDPRDGVAYRSFHRLKTNGLNESVYDRRNPHKLPKYEALLALLPYAFHPDPKNATIVGYGGGFSVDLLTSLNLQKVNAIEIEKGILKAADHVWKGRNPLLKRPNLNLQIADARFVLVTKQNGPQDLILSQPSHSWLAGTANLFTEEFFNVVKSNLSERGIYSQWLNLYNMNTEVLKSILKTFYSVFPEGAVFTNIQDDEMIMIGSNQPLQLAWDRLRSVGVTPHLQAMLTEVPFTSPESLLAQYALSRDTVVAMTADAKINTDRNAYAEARQSRLFYSTKRAAMKPNNFLSQFYKGDFRPLVPPAVVGSDDFERRVLGALDPEQQYDKVSVILKDYEAKPNLSAEDAWYLGYHTLKIQRYDSAIKYLKKAFAAKKSTDVLNLLMSTYMHTKRPEEVVRLAKVHAGKKDRITECYLLDASLQLDDKAAVERLGKKLVADINGYTRVCGTYFNKVVGNYFSAQGRYDVALNFYQAYYNAFPEDPEVLKQIGVAYEQTQDTDNANYYSQYAGEVAEKQQKHREALVRYLRENQYEGDAAALAALNS